MNFLDEKQIDDNQLFIIVSNVDEFYWKEGIDFTQREYKIWTEVMSAFGQTSFNLFGEFEPNLLKRIKSCHKLLYDQSKMPSSGSIGIFCFRDAIIKINIPIIMGRVGINPFNHAEFTEGQKIVISRDKEMSDIFLDQFWDCYDIYQWYFTGNSNFGNENELVKKYIGLAVTHQHAAAAILASSFDASGAVQNAVLCCEMCLKSCLLYIGVPEKDLKDNKKYGHNLISIISHLKNSKMQLDFERTEKVISHLPNLVNNRYGKEQIPAGNEGRLVMETQFVLSEVIRGITNVSIRNNFENCKLERVFP